ncbi:retrovirus-related pol polyprotein from transposon TNT 1-94 [Tanacetum coccineum]|uniref:Retrovirus-related pol polyprotein from transposon TNT 1-94 n=1 Tax=Tanacetum coccineum TaxID=301880 RepID=A0ABQ5EDD5_9ASTR
MADQCDAFDSDVDDSSYIKTMFMVNLSSEDPIYDEAGPSYDSNTPFEVQDHDTCVDHLDEYYEVHEMQNGIQHNYVVDSDVEYASDSNITLYNQYMEDNEEHVVQSNVSSVRNDALMSIIDNMHEQGVQKEILEIDELTRNRCYEKMKRTQCIQNKVKFAPPDYLKENYLAIFAPQTDLTPEHIFWAKDENDRKKVEASVLKPLSITDVYHPIHLKLKEWKEIFVQMSAEWTRITVDKQCVEIERKKPSHLQMEKSNCYCLSTQLMFAVEQSRCLDLEAEISKLQNENQKDVNDEMIREYVIGTCPKSFNERDYKAPSTPVTRKKQVTFNDKPGTSSSNTQKHEVHQKVQHTNVPVIHSTGVNTSTEASGSKPRSNTKKNRILLIRRKKFALGKINVVINRGPQESSLPLANCALFIKLSVKCRIGRPLVSGLRLFKTYDGESFKAQELCRKVHRDRQFCDSDLEIAFRKHSCFVRDMNGVDLLKGSRSTNLYTISLDNMMKSSPVCLLYKASKTKSWLWHRRLNHLNFGTINDLARKDLVRGLPRLKFEKDHLCSACQLGKSKKYSHKPKSKNTNMEVLHTFHMDLCGPMRVQSINGKKYILVIVDDYSRFTWVKFLRSKDETPEFVIKFLKQIQVGLNKTVRYIRTDNGTEFVNQVMTKYYEGVGIFHQKSVPRTPQQNSVIERRNHTLVEAARTMLIFSKASMFLWAVFGALCYPTNDSEDLGKLQAKADIGIFVGYAPNRKGFRIYNKRTRRIMETIHVTFDELLQTIAPVHIGSGPEPMSMTPGQFSSGLIPNQSRCSVPPATAVNAHVVPQGTSVTTTFAQDAPSTSFSPSSSRIQPPVIQHDVAIGPTNEDIPITKATIHPSITMLRRTGSK